MDKLVVSEEAALSKLFIHTNYASRKVMSRHLHFSIPLLAEAEVVSTSCTTTSRGSSSCTLRRVADRLGCVVHCVTESCDPTSKQIS